jgi:hypothetical protein
MERSAEEENRQDRYVKFICGVGVFSFLLCLFPIVFESNIDLHTPKLITFFSSSRIAIIAALFPLVCDYLNDLSLPQRLTYPRSILLLSLLVPNAVILLMSLGGSVPVRISICFKFATDQLFACGMIAYIAGEVVSKRLLMFLASVTVWISAWHVYYCIEVFITSQIPKSILMLTQLMSSMVILIIIVWFLNDMKALGKRRLMFARVYIIAFTVFVSVGFSTYLVLGGLHKGMYTEDAQLLLKLITATFVMSITSRMAQHDATITMVMTIHPSKYL